MESDIKQSVRLEDTKEFWAIAYTREFERQRQEAIIGCSILNKMMRISLGENRSKF